MQFDEVEFGAVALVLTEAIVRKPGAKVAHNRVAGDLGDDAGSSNREAVAVAIDNGCLGEGKWKNREAVNQDVVGLGRQSSQGQVHRLVGRSQNVDGIDLD